MYIIAIGWLWVVLMMAITEPSVVRGILTFVAYGLAPVTLLLWLLGTPHRKRVKARREAAAAGSMNQFADTPDRGNSEKNQ